MPGGDRTGPRGMGPMTGRGAGYCGGYGVPGYMNPMPGFGFGRGGFFGRGGRGGGRGWRNRFYATGMPGWMHWGAPRWWMPHAGFGPFTYPVMSGEDEMAALREQAAFLNGSLEEITKRISELEAGAAKGDE